MHSKPGFFYKQLLLDSGFSSLTTASPFSLCGETFSLSSRLGKGYYWVYSEADLFTIKIHDFLFYEDTQLEMTLPECLNLSYYQSISGQVLKPLHPLCTQTVSCNILGQAPCRFSVNKGIPVRSVSIDILPAYYKHYLKEKYPGEALNLYDIFAGLQETTHFPEMLPLFNQMICYRGQGLSARLFWEAKITEMISLLLTRFEGKKNQPQKPVRLPEADKQQIQYITDYIHTHVAAPLSLDQLSRLACMGTTKLKQSFKNLNGCSITTYIQQERMRQAAFLLTHTDLNISQISQAVGYTNASRFAALFHRHMGILPLQYRKSRMEI